MANVTKNNPENLLEILDGYDVSIDELQMTLMEFMHFHCENSQVLDKPYKRRSLHLKILYEFLDNQKEK